MARTSTVYQVVARPRLVAGVDFKFLAFNGLCAFEIVAVGHFWPWLAVTWVIHKILQAVARHDALMRPIFFAYAKQKDYYEPWPVETTFHNMRPRNLGRGVLR